MPTPKRTPSPEFARWADGFNVRHRFGIPMVPRTGGEPRTGKVATVPPSIVALPPRSGSMAFSDEDVTAVIELLRQCEPGQAVRLTDEADESDNTARRRAELLKEQMGAKLGDEKIKEGFKVRGHVLTAGEPTTKTNTSKKSGKEYKVTTYPENWAAVSLVPEGTPDEPAPETPETPETPEPAPTTTRRRSRS